MSQPPFTEAPSSRVLRQWWVLVGKLQALYPNCPVPELRITDTGPAVTTDDEAWQIRVNIQSHVDVRLALRTGLTHLVFRHLRGKTGSPRNPLYREIYSALE